MRSRTIFSPFHSFNIGCSVETFVKEVVSNEALQEEAEDEDDAEDFPKREEDSGVDSVAAEQWKEVAEGYRSLRHETLRLSFPKAALDVKRVLPEKYQ